MSYLWVPPPTPYAHVRITPDAHLHIAEADGTLAVKLLETGQTTADGRVPVFTLEQMHQFAREAIDNHLAYLEQGEFE
jgi:hypothetical protein